MEKLKNEYLDVCDRIYLNEQSIKKLGKRSIHNGQAITQITKQLEKDYKIKEELEEKLGF